MEAIIWRAAAEVAGEKRPVRDPMLADKQALTRVPDTACPDSCPATVPAGRSCLCLAPNLLRDTARLGMGLGAFVVFQIYELATKPSFGVVALTVLDVFIIWLTWREWRRGRELRKTWRGTVGWVFRRSPQPAS